ncbi:MAG: hypothetical protein K6G64_01705 [Eubacterium sp.]|nr:hypothetical protein [Eubacterium sp.]
MKNNYMMKRKGLEMRKKNFKRVQALVLTAAMVLPVVPVQAEENSVLIGDYVVTGDIEDVDGDESALYISSDSQVNVAMQEGVTETEQRIIIESDTTGTVTFSDVHINMSSECVLINSDADVTLVFPKNTESSFVASVGFGIYVAKDSKLTIAGEGTVNAETNGAAAAIGGGFPDESGENCAEITIQEATVNAYSKLGAAIGSGAEVDGCKVVIDGGTVNASSTFGSGIGTGYGKNCNGGTVIINDGVVNIETEQGVGIGGANDTEVGGDGANLTINGGTVTINSKGSGAGIGGGNGNESGGNGGTFLMNGGNVTVNSNLGTAIGGGLSTKKGGDGCDITVNGGTLTAITAQSYCTIGGGFAEDFDDGNETGGNGGSLTINGGTVIVQNTCTREGAVAIGGGYGIQRGENTAIKVQPKNGEQIDVEYDADDLNPKQVEGSPFISGTNVIDVDLNSRYFKASAGELDEANIIRVSDDVKVEGYQINAISGGARTVGSVPKTVNGKQVVGRGIVYALAKVNGQENDVTDKDIKVGGKNYFVRNYDLTNAPTLSLETADPNRTYFAITMLFANGGSKKEFEATYKARTYVVLEDGTIVYSDVDSYTIFAISEVLYQNQKMRNKTWHNYLYENILKVVDSSYKEVDYDWNNEIVKLK